MVWKPEGFLVVPFAEAIEGTRKKKKNEKVKKNQMKDEPLLCLCLQ